jgi:hypothetical protein
VVVSACQIRKVKSTMNFFRETAFVRRVNRPRWRRAPAAFIPRFDSQRESVRGTDGIFTGLLLLCEIS